MISRIIMEEKNINDKNPLIVIKEEILRDRIMYVTDTSEIERESELDRARTVYLVEKNGFLAVAYLYDDGDLLSTFIDRKIADSLFSSPKEDIIGYKCNESIKLVEEFILPLYHVHQKGKDFFIRIKDKKEALENLEKMRISGEYFPQNKFYFIDKILATSLGGNSLAPMLDNEKRRLLIELFTILTSVPHLLINEPTENKPGIFIPSHINALQEVKEGPLL